jgi:hypothetical protein
MPKRKKPFAIYVKCEQAIAEIYGQRGQQTTDVHCITTWLSQNHPLYEQAKVELNSNSFSVAGAEYRLCQLYEFFVRVIDLSEQKSLYKSIVDEFHLIEHDAGESRKWLDLHFNRAADTSALLGMDFWGEDCSLNRDTYPIKLFGGTDVALYINGDDFLAALRFIDLYQRAYTKYDFVTWQENLKLLDKANQNAYKFCPHYEELDILVNAKTDLENISFNIEDVEGCTKCTEEGDVCALWTNLAFVDKISSELGTPNEQISIPQLDRRMGDIAIALIRGLSNSNA